MHWIKARHALLEDREHVRFYLVAYSGAIPPVGGEWVALDPVGGGPTEHWEVEDYARLRAVLARDDLTRLRDKPLVVGNREKHLLGFAVGPAEAPSHPEIVGVYDLERAVLAAAGEGQPEWWLFDAEEGDPPLFTGASAWVAKWKAQVERGETPTFD